MRFLYRAFAAVPALMVLSLVGGCHRSPTAPASGLLLSTIRYERVRPFDPNVSGVVILTLMCPRPGDPYQRPETFLCSMQLVEPNAYICTQTRTIATDYECTEYVNDPAVTVNAVHQVGALVKLNGQPVSRIDVAANGIEAGRFRATADGRIE